METVMGRIEKHAEYYRGFQADDRSFASVAAILVTAIAMWLLFYLVSLVGPAPAPGLTATAARGVAAVTSPAPGMAQREIAR